MGGPGNLLCCSGAGLWHRLSALSGDLAQFSSQCELLGGGDSTPIRSAAELAAPVFGRTRSSWGENGGQPRRPGGYGAWAVNLTLEGGRAHRCGVPRAGRPPGPEAEQRKAEDGDRERAGRGGRGGGGGEMDRRFPSPSAAGRRRNPSDAQGRSAPGAGDIGRTLCSPERHIGHQQPFEHTTLDSMYLCPSGGRTRDGARACG